MQFNNCNFLVFHLPENYEASMRAFHQSKMRASSENNDRKPDNVRKLATVIVSEIGKSLTPTDTENVALVSKKWNILSKGELNIENARKLRCMPDEVCIKTAELKKIVSENRGRLNKKNITSLFNALFYLRKVGLASWEQLEEVATVKENKYKCCKLWAKIASEKVQSGQIQSAQGIAVKKLKFESTKRLNVFFQIVEYYVNKNNLQEAYSIYSKFLKKENVLNGMGASLINKKAAINGDYLMLEQMIEGKGTESIQHFIWILIEDGKHEIAREKVKKYRKDLDKLDRLSFFAFSIRIYIKLGFYESAKNLTESALKLSISDDNYLFYCKSTLRCLYDAYIENGLTAEAEEIQKRIDEMKGK